MNDEQKIWYSIEIEASPEAEEAVAFALTELDALGTEINNLGVRSSETLTIIGYFDEIPDGENLRSQISNSLEIHALSGDSIKKIAWREIENRDWLAEWKKHWRPTETEKFIVAPTWENIETTEKIVIRIEPGMAFGTGTHETTRLCLKAIEQNYSPEMSFLDVGTGTGILAVGAAKIQGKRQKVKGKIVGCDTDEDSIRIARENAEANGVGDLIVFYAGSISVETPASDFVCANLTADVIVPLLPLLVEKAKRILVLSGILCEQEKSIVSELKKFQITNFKIETEGEWICIKVKR